MFKGFPPFLGVAFALDGAARVAEVVAMVGGIMDVFSVFISTGVEIWIVKGCIFSVWLCFFSCGPLFTIMLLAVRWRLWCVMAL